MEERCAHTLLLLSSCNDRGALTTLACLQAVSAGARPQLDRTQEAGAPAMRAAVLSVAQQQKLAACTALLREVAGVYGFALHLNPEIGEATSGLPKLLGKPFTAL